MGFFGSKGMEWEKVEQGVIMDRHKMITGVVGIGKGAGATFTAMNLAFLMAEIVEGVTFADGRDSEQKCAGPGAMELLMVDPRFRKRVTGRTNLYKKINWVFGDDSSLRDIPGKCIIADNLSDYEDMDVLVVVVDPLPSRIEAGLETFKYIRQLQESGRLQIPVLWLLNKNNRCADVRRTETYLKIKFDLYQELLPKEIFYKAEMSCTQQFFMQRPQALERLAERILEHNK